MAEIKHLYTRFLDWLRQLKDNIQEWLCGWLCAQAPDPKPPLDILPASHWLAAYAAEWYRQWNLPLDQNKLRKMYYGDDGYMWPYFCADVIHSHTNAALAKPEDSTYWAEAILAARSQIANAVPVEGGRGWMHRGSDGMGEYEHQEIRFSGAVGYCLLAMRQHGLDQQPKYADDWRALFEFAEMLMDKWWNRYPTRGAIYRRISHIMSNSLVAVEALIALGSTLPWLPEAQAHIRQTLRDHFAKFPDGIYDEYLAPPGSRIDDTSHAQFDAWGAVVTNRLDSTYWPGAAQYFGQVWRRVFNPVTGRCTEFIDGTGDESWPGYVNLAGWTAVATGDLDIHRLMEQYRPSQSEYPFWYAGMALAAKMHQDE